MSTSRSSAQSDPPCRLAAQCHGRPASRWRRDLLRFGAGFLLAVAPVRATGGETSPPSPGADAGAPPVVVTGLRIEQILGESGSGPRQFGRPLGLAATAAGGLLVADTGNKRAQCLDPDGRFVWEAGGFGTAEGSLNRPTAVALATGLEFLILDAGGRRILQFHARGQYLGIGLDFERRDLVTRVGEVDPRGMTVDREGNVLVSEREGDRLLVFSPVWNLLFVVGGFGVGPQHFEDPEGVAATRNRIYVADSGNGRIQVLDSLGRFLASWPLPGGGRPLGLAVDRHGHLFVTDADGDRIVVFNRNGKAVFTFGVRGDGPGSFRGPAAACVIEDHLFIADSENDRLVRLVIEYGPESRPDSGDSAPTPADAPVPGLPGRR